MIANQKIGSANSSAVVPMAFNEDIERGPMKTKTNQEKSLQRQYSNLSSNTELWTASSTTAQVFGTTKLQPKVGNDFFVSKPALSSASSSNTSPHLSRNKLSYADVESIHQGSQLHKDDPFVTHRDFDTIKSYLTSYYSLKDVELRATFQQFNETRRSVGLFYFFMTIVFTLIIFPASALEFFGDIDAYSEYHSVPKYNQRIASSVILFINNLGGILSSWYLLSFYMPYSLFRFFPRHCGKLYEYLVKWNNQKCIRCAKTVLVCCIQVFFLGMLCQRSLNLNCVTPINSYSKFFNGQLCYEGLALQNIILAQGFVALTIPLLISVNLPEVVIEVVWANFILAFFVSILVCVASSQYDNILYLLIWSAVGFFSIIDTQIRNVTMFFVNMDLNLALSEVRRIEEENRANEMRHMIANVAHDLKTVSNLYFRSLLLPIRILITVSFVFLAIVLAVFWNRIYQFISIRTSWQFYFH